jgi:hypothetical protein
LYGLTHFFARFLDRHSLQAAQIGDDFAQVARFFRYLTHRSYFWAFAWFNVPLGKSQTTGLVLY